MKRWFDELSKDLENEIKEFVGKNTLIGDPILLYKNISVIPFFEMVVMLGEGHTKFEFDFLGSGVEIKPTAFLVIHNGESEVILVRNDDAKLFVTEKILDVTI